VATPEDVAFLPLDDDAPIAYVTQTTLSVDDTRGVIAALHERFSDVAGPDVSDICYATQNRQNAVRALVEECDALIVVGAANSSNSNRLRDVALALGKPAWLVGDGSEVSMDWLDGVERLASPPGPARPRNWSKM
jgi:4-hydroxy-3-methylbut-2-enyl diphosphate reductase